MLTVILTPCFTYKNQHFIIQNSYYPIEHIRNKIRFT